MKKKFNTYSYAQTPSGFECKFVNSFTLNEGNIFYKELNRLEVDECLVKNIPMRGKLNSTLYRRVE